MGSVERGLDADEREMEQGRGENKTVGDGDLGGSVSEEGSRGYGGKRGGMSIGMEGWAEEEVVGEVCEGGLEEKSACVVEEVWFEGED